MNGMNERTPESYECKRQLHLQKQCEQSWARLACETKEQRQRKLQPRRKARKRREQSRRTEETSKIERVSRKPATSFSETMSAKTSKAWTCAGVSRILWREGRRVATSLTGQLRRLSLFFLSSEQPIGWISTPLKPPPFPPPPLDPLVTWDPCSYVRISLPTSEDAKVWVQRLLYANFADARSLALKFRGNMWRVKRIYFMAIRANFIYDLSYLLEVPWINFFSFIHFYKKLRFGATPPHLN